MNLKLITTESFGTIPCNFYRNANDDILLTREQIGSALAYANPQKAIQKIHLKHKDRLEDHCIRIVENRVPQNGGVGVNVETVYYSQRGIMEICRWSRQPKANQFMDWAWDIIEKYRSSSLESQNLAPILSQITQTLNLLANNMTLMQQSIQRLESAQNNQLKDKKYPTAYYRKLAPKYKLLEEYFDCDRARLYSEIYKELEDTYDVDLAQIHEEYCYKNNLNKNECYIMDAIEHHDLLKDALVLLINSSLIKFGLKTEEELKPKKRKTLFDKKV